MYKDDFWSIDRLLPKIQSSFSDRSKNSIPLKDLNGEEETKNFGKAFYPSRSRVIRFYRLTEAVFPRNDLILSSDSEKHVPFVPCTLYSPTMLSLTKEQRTYFFYFCSQINLRKKTETSFSYIILYLCRLLRKIETGNTIFDDIFWLWETYREDFPLLDKLFSDTVSDYCFYKHLPFPFEKIGKIVTKKDFHIRPFLLDPYIFDYLFSEDHKLTSEEINYLIRILTNESFRKTKAYKTNSLFASAAEEAMAKAFSQGLFNRKDLNESLFRIQIPSQVSVTRKLFVGLPSGEAPQLEINLSYLPLLHDENIHYRCDEILKYLENRIRGILKIKNALSRIHIGSEHKAFLEGILLEYEHLSPVTEENTPPKIEKFKPRKLEIDTRQAAKIEEESWALTQKLTESYAEENTEIVIIGDEPSKTFDEVSEKQLNKINRKEIDPLENEFWEFAALLSPEEDRFISVSVNEGKDKGREYALSLGMFYEGMVAACNEKAIEAIGDGVMTPYGEIYEEYLADLKEVFPEMKGE